MTKSVIKFTRTRNVKLPTRGHAHDAGIDFYVPEFDLTFMKDLKLKNPDLSKSSPSYLPQSMGGSLILSDGSNLASVQFDLSDPNNSIVKYDDEIGSNYILLAPLSRINIPSGIYCQMEQEGRALIAHNKSGVASKHGLVFGAQVVDFEYQGEIHINVLNLSSKVVRIYAGQKLMQFVEIPIFTSIIEEVENLQKLYKGATSRADGGFGSTDKKEIQQLNS